MVTLKVFDNAIDAHILRTKLESEGIPCYIFDENITSLNPLLTVAVGGIKLNVAAEDFEKAYEIMNISEMAELTDDDSEIIRCPKCGSTRIDNNYNKPDGLKSILASIFSFLTFTFPVFLKKSYRCKDCDEAFPYKQED